MNGTNGPPRILVVDDEFLIADLIQSVLEGEGFGIAGTVGTVGAALATTRAEKPDLAIVDVRLAQGGDGVELARDLIERHGVPVLFISGSGDPETVARTRTVNARGFLRKPFRAQGLIDAVRQVVGGQTAPLRT